MWYVSKLDEANWSLLARVGLLKPSSSRDQSRGFVALRQEIAYKREVFAGDLLEIKSRILEVREKIVRFVHEMLNSETGDVVAICEMTTIHMDRATRKSARIPSEIREAALQQIVPSESIATRPQFRPQSALHRGRGCHFIHTHGEY
jgi:acyl-CoA thioester hydrolase